MTNPEKEMLADSSNLVPSNYNGSQPKGVQYPGYPAQHQRYRPQIVLVPVDPAEIEELEEMERKFNLFDQDPALRMLFIRKVYGLLLAQLVVTAGIMSLFIFIEPVQTFFRVNYWIMFIVLFKLIVLLIIMLCCPNVRRNFPLNLILLFLLTIDYGLLLGILSARYGLEEILLAGGITIAIFLLLTILAFVIPYDFTKWAPYVLIVVVILIIFSFLAGFLRYRFPIVNIIYTCVGVLIVSFYIVYDTQLMMSGKTHHLSPDEHVFAALNLYIDVVTIFCCILQGFR